MSERWTVIPAVYLILKKDGKVLLARRFNTGYMDGQFSLPAGHLNGGETAMQAAVREAKEEIGVDIDASDMRLTHVMHRVAEEGNHERVDLFFEVAKWQNTPIIMEPHKCDQIEWVPIIDLPKNTVPVVRRALERSTKGINYSEMNFRES